MRRERTADTTYDVGPWTNIENEYPYVTWAKENPDGTIVHVLLSDAAPDAPADYWSHIEYKRPGSDKFEWSEERLPEGDNHRLVERETIRWLRANPDWEPPEQTRWEKHDDYAHQFGIGSLF